LFERRSWLLVQVGRNRSNPHNELPSLRLRQKTERRHALTRVAATDFPEQRAVGLRLNGRLREVGALRRPTSVVAVTRRTSLVKELAATGLRFRTIRDRIQSCRDFWWRDPLGIPFADLHRGSGDDGHQGDGCNEPGGKQGSRHHRCPPRIGSSYEYPSRSR